MPASIAMPPASGAPASAKDAARTSPWIYNPWIDLAIGCGAWSAPLLLVTSYVAGSRAAGWSFAFYMLALLFNYPHFMATVYRAYHLYGEFAKYQFFTVHGAVLLASAGLMAHLWYPLLPWIFTLYICWSPWHYTGQNFGILMMFARRAGLSPTNREREALQLAFMASYLMLLFSFHTGPSGDALILSLGLPAKFTLPARAMLGLFFIAASGWALVSLAKRNNWKSAVADGDAGDHTVPVVLVARSDRARERPGSAADPLLRRDPGGFTLGPVSLDYQLLPEKRGARGGSDLLEFRALPARTGGGRHRAFCARTLDREPAVSRRFCLQLSDVHGARKPSPFHAGRSDLEVARLARRRASPGQSGAPSGQGPRREQSGRRLRPLAGGKNFRGARPARWHRRGAAGLGRDGPLAFLLGKRFPESLFSRTRGATESARQRTRDAASSRSSSGGKQ